MNNISIGPEYKKGEYGYDLEFLKKYLNPLELVNSDSRLVIEPEYQGRVMTSSSSGLKGFSYGWINYDLIGSSTIQEHINPYGGEERIWLGPEGGQFSLKKVLLLNLRTGLCRQNLIRNLLKLQIRMIRALLCCLFSC